MAAHDRRVDEEVRIPGMQVPNDLARDPLFGTVSVGLRGVTEHNLKGIDVDFPLRRLVCVTGVSGSGKSTLIQDVLNPALRKHLGKPTETPGAFKKLVGAEHVNDIVFVDIVLPETETGPFVVQLVDGEKAINAGKLQKAVEGDWLMYSFSAQDLSHVVSVTVLDKSGGLVLTGTARPFAGP